MNDSDPFDVLNLSAPNFTTDFVFRQSLPGFFNDAIFPTLPKPFSVRYLVITEATLERTIQKDDPILKLKVLPPLKPYKAGDKITILVYPMQVRTLLTNFIASYTDYQFTIRFLKFISLARDAKKIMSYDADLNQRYEQLTKNTDAAIYGLQEQINGIESDYVQKIAAVAIGKFSPKDPFYFLNIKKVGSDNAQALIQDVKPDADKELTSFFRKGRVQVLTETNFKDATLNDNLSTGENGYGLLRDFEKFESRPYDTDGGDNCTIGYGHLLHVGKCTAADFARYPNGISQPEAEALLREDVKSREERVRQGVRIPLTQNQFDALVCFLFTLPNLTPKLLAKLNAGDYQGASDEMKDVVSSGGRRLEGLVRRREAEVRLFNR